MSSLEGEMRLRAALLLALLGCTDGMSGPRAPLERVASVAIVPTNVWVALGIPVYLSAIVRDTGGFVLLGHVVSWTSTDSTIAFVSGGTLLTFRMGQTRITAISEGVSGDATVTITGPALVRVLPDSAPIEVGQTAYFSAWAYDSLGRNVWGYGSVAWQSSDTTKARVSARGVVTAVGAGPATIRGTILGKTGMALVRVFPTVPVRSVTAAPDTLTAYVNNFARLRVDIRDTLGNRVYSRNVAWSTSDTSIATATGWPDGALVRTLAAGTVTISATSEGKQGTATLRVLPTPVVARIVMTPPSSVTLPIGRSLRFTATAQDTSGNPLPVYVPISWSTSDSTKVRLDYSTVTSVALGSATITATGGGQSATAMITVTTPSPLPLVSTTAGLNHSCGLTRAGEAYCWGFNLFGTRGDGSAIDSLKHPVPGRVSGGQVFTSLSAGAFHVCGVTTSSIPYCWGGNLHGELGVGSAKLTCTMYYWVTPCSTVPVPVVGGLMVRQMSAGSSSTCALTTTGDAYCWGDNSNGQLGNGSNTPSTAPVAVSGGLHFSMLTSGRSHNCGLTTDGRAYCWGSNSSGQLGTLTKTTCTNLYIIPCSLVPVAVSGGEFTTIAAGGDHTCGLTSGGAAYCWGSNASGELGTGGPTLSVTPVPVVAPLSLSDALTFRAIALGEAHTCAVATTGATYCWGSNSAGQLGDGTITPPLRTTPTLVAGDFLFESISAGQIHNCGVVAGVDGVGGAAYCWGHNGAGQLGTGSVLEGRPRPPSLPVTTP